ncbi:MAG TPA: hypothetical protein VGI73_12890 [Solirubrobacterales bacterium]|jgi:hypothetical protein
MSRRLKLLGTAIAVAAFSVVLVAQASAAEFKFASAPTWLEGIQVTKHELAVSGGVVKCSTVEFKSTAAISSTSAFSVEVHPTYVSCRLAGTVVSVVTTSCSYVLSVNVGGVPLGGLAEIKCSGATSMEIKVPGVCSISVPSQSHSSSTVSPNSYAVSYTSMTGAVEEVLVQNQVTGLNYGTSGGVCGAGGSNGTYSGTTLVGGYKSNTFSEPHAINVS